MVITFSIPWFASMQAKTQGCIRGNLLAFGTNTCSVMSHSGTSNATNAPYSYFPPNMYRNLCLGFNTPLRITITGMYSRCNGILCCNVIFVLSVLYKIVVVSKTDLRTLNTFLVISLFGKKITSDCFLLHTFLCTGNVSVCSDMCMDILK